MYYVSILQSEKTGRYYIGQARSLKDRLKRHNHMLVPSTKHGVPWTMVFHETHETRADAMSREREIKKFKGGIFFKKLIGLWQE